MKEGYHILFLIAFLFPRYSVCALDDLFQPLVDGGKSLCNPLRSGKPVRKAEGIVCLRTHTEDLEHLDVEIYIDSEGWEVDDAFLWIGTNATDVPSTTQNDNIRITQYDGFPFVRRSVGEERISFQVSLQHALNFSCPSDTASSSEYLATVRTTIRPQEGNDRLDLRLFVSPNDDNVEEFLPPLVSFKLSCKNSSLQEGGSPAASSSTSARRRKRNLQTTCPDYPSDFKFNLTETNMTQILVAAELMIIVTIEDSGCITKHINEQRAVYERFDGFWDINDQALVAKTREDGVCYVIIMGTWGINPYDQLQNFFIQRREIKGTDCVVREGFRDAYNTSYRWAFRRSIEECVNSCANGTTCPLVLGGHSQGGSAATVASIDLRHYNPTIVSFGSPRTFLVDDDFPCSDFKEERHYRIVNTIDPGIYDSVAFGTGLSAMLVDSDHMGTLLLLDDVNWPIACPGNNDNREPGDPFAAHIRSLYLSRIQNIVARQCFPVPVGHWLAGHYCTKGDECAGECVGNICT